MNAQLRRSPLHERHQALGARFAAFGGWEMPLEYRGVLSEHQAVREGVGVFDVSHLGKATVTGPGAVEFLNACLTADLARIGPGRSQYTLCCDDATGGVIDDLITYVHSAEEVFLIPNAANTAEVVRRLAGAAPGGVEVVNRHGEYAILAVQGPRSAELLQGLGLPTEHEFRAFVPASFKGTPLTVCRTGYTGEHGYELVLPWDGAGPVWDALLAGGDVRPAGLAARDTLRTEMGYPLHGQDLSPEITPVQAGMGWAVGWRKPAFWGRDALLAEKAAGPARLLRGLVATDRGIPRPHMTVLRDGQPIGEVTSGTFSPTRRVGIALALLSTSAGLSDGDEVQVDVRGRPSPMTITKPPFVRPSVK